MSDIIRTKRTYLREIDLTDAEDIVKWRSNPEAFKFFKNPHKVTLEEHLNWFNNNYMSNARRHDWICMAEGSQQKLGVFGIVEDGNIVEINYLLAPEAQGQGYATEVLSALVNYAKEKCHAGEVIAEIHKDNLPSARVAQKLGFELKDTQGTFNIYSLELI